MRVMVMGHQPRQRTSHSRLLHLIVQMLRDSAGPGSDSGEQQTLDGAKAACDLWLIRWSCYPSQSCDVKTVQESRRGS